MSVKYTTSYSGNNQLQVPFVPGTATPSKQTANINAIRNWANNQGPSCLRWVVVRSAVNGAIYSTATAIPTFVAIDLNISLFFTAPPSGAVECSLFGQYVAGAGNSFPEVGWVINEGITNNIVTQNFLTGSGVATVSNSITTVLGVVTGLLPGTLYTAIAVWSVFGGGGGTVQIGSGPNNGPVIHKVTALPAVGN